MVHDSQPTGQILQKMCPQVQIISRTCGRSTSRWTTRSVPPPACFCFGVFTSVPLPGRLQARRSRSEKAWCGVWWWTGGSKLPGTETFEGRFTGLTPYQAANKALSKYYRETNKPKKQITFTIRESTRGSKRSLYSYNGKREKLKTPVQYSINDGRTITKNYKNRLTKIKKAELASLEV